MEHVLQSARDYGQDWTVEKLDTLSSSIPEIMADLTGAMKELRREFASGELIQRDFVEARLAHTKLYDKMKQAEGILGL
jgi:hypothetical protein